MRNLTETHQALYEEIYHSRPTSERCFRQEHWTSIGLPGTLADNFDLVSDCLSSLNVQNLVVAIVEGRPPFLECSQLGFSKQEIEKYFEESEISHFDYVAFSDSGKWGIFGENIDLTLLGSSEPIIWSRLSRRDLIQIERTFTEYVQDELDWMPKYSRSLLKAISWPSRK